MIDKENMLLLHDNDMITRQRFLPETQGWIES